MTVTSSLKIKQEIKQKLSYNKKDYIFKLTKDGSMKLIIPLLIVSLFSFSCKKEKEEEEKPTEVFRFGKEISQERSLSAEEFELVKTTCTDLQNKREYFEARGDRELSFTFTLRQALCGDSEYSTPEDVAVTLRVPRSGDVTFEEPRVGNFAGDILTDVHPSLEAICSEVLKDNNVTNTITSGAIKYQYRYLKAKEGVILEIAKFSQNSTGAYFPTFIESFSVLSSGYKDYSGMTYERYRVTECSDGSSQVFRQTLKR
jgi:hypothetical protein